MSLHFLHEIEKLKKRLLELCALVDQTVIEAVQALQTRDLTLAKEVSLTDERIDCWEVEIEEECQKVLALHQPVAHDLRFIIAVLKMNNELERIGDAAVHIAERVLLLAPHDIGKMPFDFVDMSHKTQAMLQKSLDALINLDEKADREVIEADAEIDAINRRIFDEIGQMLERRTHPAEAMLHLLIVARHLERIADHTTNIAEDVIYMTSGDIVRHRVKGGGDDGPPR